jgi:copper chaperone
MERATIAIEGMSCGHCVAAVKKALEVLGGVEIEHVSIGSATVIYDPDAVSIEQIREAVRSAGYEPTVGAGR